jgi:poly(3-hydroxybutyrate) depolymerase/sugar lactone lactonase YvrE
VRRSFARRVPLGCGTVLAALILSALPLPAMARVTVKITVDGIVRQALVDPGKDAATIPSPLVFAFHGAGQTSTDMAKLGLSQAWPEATIVYPQASTHFNPVSGSTGTLWQALPGEYEDQDVRFVDALLKQISATYRVDERRVYATGLSNGAAFTYLLLTVRPEQFAAFAPVAITARPYLKWARVPRPVLITHGQADPISLSTAEWARNQVQRLNGCGTKTTDWARGAVLLQPGASGQACVLSVHSGGHEWPSDATANIVRFFKEQALSAAPTAPAAPVHLGAGGAVAGSGRAGFSGEGGMATAAQLLFPEAVALKADGSLFIADTGNQRVRQVRLDQTIMTVAGQAAASAFQDPDREGIAATGAHFYAPEGLVLDRAGNLLIADTLDRMVRQVTPEGIISTVAGKARSSVHISFSGDNGPATQAELSFPTGLAVDSHRRLFIADTENHRVRMVDPEGKITTVAGTGAPGFSGDGKAATAAQLNEPWGLAVDRHGNLFIVDASNHRIRKRTPEGRITTVAGAGTPGYSGDGGPARRAQLNHPLGLAVDSQGNLFIVDQRNYRVRRVAPNGVITTVFGGAGAPAAPRYYPSSVAVDRSGSLLIADPFNHRIWKVAGMAAPGLIAGQPFP